MFESSVVSTWKSQESVSTGMLFWRAADCSTAVRKPVGNVNALSQKIFGGCAASAHCAKWSTRATRSRVHDASGFIDAYVCVNDNDNDNENHNNNDNHNDNHNERSKR